MRERVKANQTSEEFPDFTMETGPLPGVRRMVVQWGDETIQPIQYNGFHVGQLEIEIEIPPGADPRKLHAEAFQLLEELGQQQYEAKLEGFLKRAADAAKQVRARAPGR